MCPIGFLMLGSTLQDLPSDSPAACRSACRRRRARSAPAPANERSSRAPGLSWSATRPSWPLPNHLPRRRPGPHRGLGWPSSACASFETRRRLRQTTSRAWMQRRPRRPRPSQPYGCLPHRRAPRPHFGRTQRTRQRTNTGRPHRTPDSGHLDPQTPAPDTGHRTPDTGPVDRQAWTLAARTRHRTPDTRRWPRTWTG